ncbi:hypothetical protein V6N12_012681 [Hibiscus sabdariffa]|uniref:Uncharacterized protein n=1 Tax=Hibiscus sabdariffa TaxID=183260 RepID=A0ABR2DD83_9ROSI
MKTEVGRNMPRQAEKWAEFLLRHWLLVLGSGNFVLNDLNDDFVVVPGVYHEGQPPSLTSVNPSCKICLWW